MKKILFLICFIALSANVKAQEYCYSCDPDSLQAQLKLKKSPAEKIKILEWLIESNRFEEDNSLQLQFINQLIEYNQQSKTIDPDPYVKMQEAMLLYKKNDWKGALTKHKESIELFDKSKKVIATRLVRIRILFNKLNDPEGRLKYYTEKLAYYKVNGPVENTAPCYHGLGGYYALKNDFNSAISNYLKAASVYKKFDSFYYANEIAVISTMYANWGNYNKAKEYFNMALPLLKRQKDGLSSQSYLYDALIPMSIKNGNYKEAELYAKRSLKNSAPNPPAYAISLLNYASIYLSQKMPALAYPYLLKAKLVGDAAQVELISTYGDFEEDFRFYQYYKQTKNYQLAEQYLLSAYREAQKSKSNKYLLKYLKELSDYYGETNRLDLSRKYIVEYLKLDDIIQTQESNFKVAQYETEQKEQEQNSKLATLQQERAIQEATINQRNTILWVSLAGFLAVCGLSFFVYRQLQKNKKTLASLKETQSQLIQSEKMASLGELTAGIAHEIKNPLNFVNNFSEVSMELIEEVKSEKLKAESERDSDLENELLDDISQNLQKIAHHGKRADSIVKGMLQHSRTSTRERQATNLNVLADEFLKLSYHGLRAKDKSFNAELVTNFDVNLPKVNVVQQDIGRVLLNLFNNAFYAVQERRKAEGEGFNPTVEVSTLFSEGYVTVKVRDNGNGIPEAIKEKIMQPFFTTKPTGEGTGLGLSLSYDIIKAHGGELKVETEERLGSEFIVKLPIRTTE